MNEILVLTNNEQDTHVINFAYQIALKSSKNLIVAQLSKPQPVRVLQYELVVDRDDLAKENDMYFNNYFNTSATVSPNMFHPLVKRVSIAGLSEKELTAFICHENCQMVIAQSGLNDLQLKKVVDHINCPFMFLPVDITTANITRIVYLTDIRYCQQHIISYLTKFQQCSLLLAHICESGLPDLTASYGEQLFNDTIARYGLQAGLFFSHIKESNIDTIVDTLINVMHTDLLVCVNRKFHFRQLLGNQLPQVLPEHITMPVLIFPY
jgi:hypothetical protein